MNEVSTLEDSKDSNPKPRCRKQNLKQLRMEVDEMYGPESHRNNTICVRKPKNLSKASSGKGVTARNSTLSLSAKSSASPLAINQLEKIFPQGYKAVHWFMEERRLINRLRLILSKLEELSQYEMPDVLKKHTPMSLLLCNQNFMKHPSKNVQTLIALCLADVLRIFAPHEPFSREQMTGILTLFINQYEGLKYPHGANFSYHEKLLSNLAQIGAFNSCNGLDENIISSLFQITFQTLTEENWIYLHAPMLQILSNLVSDDGAFLTADVLMIILINILEPNKSLKVPSYHLAKELLVRCHVPLITCIHNFLQRILHEREDNLVQLDHDKAYKVFDVVTELTKICPGSMLHDLFHLG